MCQSCRDRVKKYREKQREKQQLDAIPAQEKGSVVAVADVNTAENPGVTNVETATTAAVKRKSPTTAPPPSKRAKLPDQAPTTDYQYLSNLLASLAAAGLKGRVQLSGTYSIIAEPHIDHEQRIGRVSGALREKLPHDLQPLPNAESTAPNARTHTYACRCAEAASAHYYRSACGGTVRIRVEDDGTHPLGLAGQKISVWVEHHGR
ncbi:hypothetical protein PLICRDRAFT_39001 [Plicaturopsis crispa FD-325 SS-3]|nr:hypothetical protein PLICRDRAFT_39001 [Plicaturopsis crispa FD-325 SS-3]